MKLTAQLQLRPSKEQSQALEETLRVANTACDYLAQLAWDNQTFGQYNLHRLGYEECRARFGLSSQVIVRCVAKVADAYKLDQKSKRTFKPLGSIAYDDRILTYQLDKGQVSIWTTAGRIKIPFICGERQRQLLPTRQGESDLCLIKGQWFLLSTCTVEEPSTNSQGGVIGIDLGIVEIASTSEGKSYSGEKVKALRKKLREHRRRLQKCGTKNAKRRLKKAAKRQERFVRNENHRISKELVHEARISHKALALEDLKGIRAASTGFHKEMRWLLEQLGLRPTSLLRAVQRHSCGRRGARGEPAQHFAHLQRLRALREGQSQKSSAFQVQKVWVPEQCRQQRFSEHRT